VAWVWNEHGVQRIRLSLAEPALSLPVRRFVEHCSDPSSSPDIVRQESSALYVELIRPIEESLAGHRQLVIEPDGILRNLPFEALLDEHKIYLGDRFEVTISPGIEYLTRSANWHALHQAHRYGRGERGQRGSVSAGR
jgi:CHAT domain-containing protein